MKSPNAAKTEGEEGGIATTHNTARYFVENRAVSFVMIVLVVLAGLNGYRRMPKQKDPTIPVRVALATTPWPGVDAQKVELLVTKLVESTIATNSKIHPPEAGKYGIQSLSLPGVSLIRVSLSEEVQDTEREFNDIHLKLDALNAQLPEGAGPIQFRAGFGETAALLLTIGSPREREISVELRARSAAKRLTTERADYPNAERAAVFVVLPRQAPTDALARTVLDPLAEAIETAGAGKDARVIQGNAFVAIDATIDGDPKALLAFCRTYASDVLNRPDFHPDTWQPFVVRQPEEIEAAMQKVVGPRYTYRQLEDIADLVSRTLEDVHEVSKVLKSGNLQEQVEVLYSQEQLAALSIPLAKVVSTLAERNPGLAGGTAEALGTGIPVWATGEIDTLEELGDIVVARSDSDDPVYLRQLGELLHTYQNPPSLLNAYTSLEEDGEWVRRPAVTLAVQMREGEQIAAFGAKVDQALRALEERLPEDLVIARTSDQPRQVEQNVDLFMTALYEAILLVVIVAWVGFGSWRSALLMMISIPLTLAMTFAVLDPLGISVQQISLAAMIIALGLLVDDPVVAGDAIQRQLSEGRPRKLASWMGPTLLASAILYATVTNVVAYLPFTLLTGDTGDFIASLPIVMATALIASRLVSMTFVPFLGYYLLRAPRRKEPTMEDRRSKGFSGFYFRTVRRLIGKLRWPVLAVFLALMTGGFYMGSHLKRSFFPHDVQYLSTVDIWLPNGSNVYATADTTAKVEEIIERVAAKAHDDGVIQGKLVSLTSFVGGSSPRFWSTFQPRFSQPNYAQLLMETEDKDDTPPLAPLLQAALSAEVPGAWVDVLQLELNPLRYPVALRLSARSAVGEEHAARDIEKLRIAGEELIAIMRGAESAERVRGDWGAQSFDARVDVNSDVASLSGVSNHDVSLALQAGFDGLDITSMRVEGHRIPVVMRLRQDERPSLAELGSLYVYPGTGAPAVTLGAIATHEAALTSSHLARLDHFRTITVFGYPRPGALAGDVMEEIAGPLADYIDRLPPGYQVDLSGEPARQKSGFTNLAQILVVSATGIFLALVFQFRDIVKPLVVLCGVPFGFAGGLVTLRLMNESLSFMAFLGLISLVGVIVSHIIVLFTFIEDRRREGETLELALLDAGIVRLRPVMITVAATVLALVPLAIHGGPLWQPLCYAQIGGLTVATFISLVIIPVLYSICVKDLKVIRWKASEASEAN